MEAVSRYRRKLLNTGEWTTLPKFHMIRDTQTRSSGIVVAFLVDIITKEAIELRVRFKFGSLIRRKGNKAGIVKDKTEE